MIMSREVLLKEVRKSVPNLGWDNKYPNLFGKYGKTVFRVFCDDWIWLDSLESASNEELLEMLAITNGYWYRKYKNWAETKEEKSNILDNFIGTCEAEFFGYAQYYDIEQIDKILNNILTFLRKNLRKSNDE